VGKTLCLDCLASPAPAASSKSSYRNCPGVKQFGSTRRLAAGALVDRALRFFDSESRTVLIQGI
jgi:hypothetical protein